MSFQDVEGEIRQRFSETLLMHNHLRSIAPPPLTPLDDVQKSLRGLWLVSLYAAVERSTNAIVEAAIQEVSGHRVSSISSVPALHSVFHFSMVQSLRDCGRNKVFDAARSLFEASYASAPMYAKDNPLSDSLQNVDAGTMVWVMQVFGAQPMEVPVDRSGRLSTLRERRNAVAHGREPASEVGERYSLDEMMNLYNAADTTIAEFHLQLKAYCVDRRYIRASA